MRVTEHIHSLLLNFEIEMPTGAKIKRFVPVYVIDSEHLTVIDTGVKSGAEEIFECIESFGRKPEDVEFVINTHGHFDHVGGNGVLAERAQPRFFAHRRDKAIIESLEYQERSRPVGNMCEKNTSGSVRVTDLLDEGDVIDLGGDMKIEVLHTPGHSPGSISLYIPSEGALFCGDVLPEPGALPIYEDMGQTLESLNKLRAINGAEVLLSQLSDRIWRGAEVQVHINNGEAYIRIINELVHQASAELGEAASVKDIGARVFSELGLPEAGLIPIVQTSIMAHLTAESLG